MRLRTILVLLAILLVGVLVVTYVVVYAPRPDTSGFISSAGRPQDKNNSEDLLGALDDAERAYTETELLKERLIEQGYSEDVLEDLFASGAQRALQLPYIAAVKEIYGYPWNIPLVVGDFTLVDLYVISEKFVLGHYEDESEERVLWLHMSVTESYDFLQAGLSYSKVVESQNVTTYIDSKGNTVGFAFWVLLDSENKIFSRYVATASFNVTQAIVQDFTGSVVDGSLGIMGYEPN